MSSKREINKMKRVRLAYKKVLNALYKVPELDGILFEYCVVKHGDMQATLRDIIYGIEMIIHDETKGKDR